jgi:2-keto-4-pentenoate hydratase/2-oxohepta-3-ene-1,7-dioic acid hydratase in catechol pathway
MRIANLGGRLVLLAGQRAIDVERASDGQFGADPQAVYDRWDEFFAWARTRNALGEPFEPDQLQAPAPRPPQVFAVGLNYRSHADEVGYDHERVAPPVFTKFPTSITGPYADVEHPGGSVDWEVELVVIMGRRAYRVPEARAWEYVAGVTVGQDISERELQHEGELPQFSLGKSYTGFAPMGPWLTTLDELDDPDNLELLCTVNGQTVQEATTAQLILGVPQLIERLSRVTALLPGDAIFTGTPAGVGMAREPQMFLSPGDELVSSIKGLGELRNRIVNGTLPA